MKHSDRKLKSPIWKSAVRHWVNYLLFAFGTLFLLLVVAPMFTPMAPDSETIAQLDYNLPPPAIVLTSLLTWSGYSVSAYVEGWHLGSRDHNLVKYDHMSYAPLRGLWGNLTAQIPIAVLALAAVLRGAGLPAFEWALMTNRTYGSPFLWLFTLCDADAHPLAFFLPILIQPPLALWGYHNGYRFFSLYRRIVYRDPHGERNNRERDRRLR